MKSNYLKNKIFASRLTRPGVLFLVLTWIAVAAALVLYRYDERFAAAQLPAGPDDLKTAARTIEAFQTWRADPADKSRPLYRLSFDSLTASNASIGAFRTALHKTVTIKDLNLRLYTYSTPQGENSSPQAVLTAAGPEKDRVVVELMHKITGADGPWKLGPDVSNTTEVLVRGFDYTLLRDHKPGLRIESMRAEVASWPRISLRGCVTVTAADGSQIQSNSIIWDAKTDIFRVPGSYYLTKNGESVTGRGLTVDSCLNPPRRQAAATASERNEKNG